MEDLSYLPTFIPNDPPPNVLVRSEWGEWACHKAVLSKSAGFREAFEDDPTMTEVEYHHPDEVIGGALFCFLYIGDISKDEGENSDTCKYILLWVCNEGHQIAGLDQQIREKLLDKSFFDSDYILREAMELVYERIGDSGRDVALKKAVAAAHAVEFVSFCAADDEQLSATEAESWDGDMLASVIGYHPQLAAHLIEALVAELGSNTAKKMSLTIKELVFGKGWLISGKKSRDFE